ncbi:class I SAM-dependent methyltransferase [Streptomyces ipomoeae]|jgi:SAM-dependent methyltransferase|uniref:Methyltransferase domain protein n=2 Tax=Streptomyces ipomoeae TaxID=103232 RepID=L1KKN7_9ACTN|nr:methyltransferase domain-containing protein [Streptomyces ipomoeae]EKX61134.1 methyltransferase domain protein [Streptomyces ipomoeae 91-03]MDX2694701.1 methyltransferase domain-containing protein [Streptomyces ipomoeae]MDX2821932.1 methyltransferase domain-containing protein [Streptomyces ipomoeae]MDX2839876.1 methyltransferase domain-containing protein [Streptomyces ipomoeae]MDX2874647.1 methyltransferase domain-containing protein [Streptomyces ipomoeae]
MSSLEARRALPDPVKKEAFAAEVLDVLNKAALALLVGVGHQCGLFDTMAGLPPSSSVDIARAADLDERYVREWLGGMVVGGFVEYEPDGGTYFLPPEHAASLTTAAGPENLAGMMPYIGLMGEVEQQVVRCFRDGGGVPYSAYPRFQALQAEESARVYDMALVDVILPVVPGLTERLRSGIDVLDVGTGQGHAPLVLAKAFPNSRFHGLDQSEDGIEAARVEAARAGLGNVRYSAADSTEISGTYDLITAFDVIHDLARPAETLTAIACALRDDGTFLMGDIGASSRLEENIGHPFGPALYGFSVFYCMTTSLSTGGAGLGTVWGQQTAVRMLEEAGFGNIDVKSVEGDPVNVYYVATRR